MIHDYSFRIKLVELKEKHWINPVVPSNIAITHINPETETILELFNFQEPGAY